MLGTPGMRGSGSTAMRRARAVALKTASQCDGCCGRGAGDVQIHQGVGGEGLPEIFDEFAVELADLCGGNGDLKHEEVAAAQVEGRGDQRFFHRQREVAVAADAGFVAEGLLERLAQGNADVFDRVMLIDVQIALGLHVQIDGRMLGQKREHVIEKADAGGDVAVARAVEVELDVDLRFSGFAIDGGGAGHGSEGSNGLRCQSGW